MADKKPSLTDRGLGILRGLVANKGKSLEGYNNVTNKVRDLSRVYGYKLRAVLGVDEKLKRDILNDLLSIFGYSSVDDVLSRIENNSFDINTFKVMKEGMPKLMTERYGDLNQKIYLYVLDQIAIIGQVYDARLSVRKVSKYEKTQVDLSSSGQDVETQAVRSKISDGDLDLPRLPKMEVKQQQEVDYTELTIPDAQQSVLVSQNDAELWASAEARVLGVINEVLKNLDDPYQLSPTFEALMTYFNSVSHKGKILIANAVYNKLLLNEDVVNYLRTKASYLWTMLFPIMSYEPLLFIEKKGKFSNMETSQVEVEYRRLYKIVDQYYKIFNFKRIRELRASLQKSFASNAIPDLANVDVTVVSEVSYVSEFKQDVNSKLSKWTEGVYSIVENFSTAVNQHLEDLYSFGRANKKWAMGIGAAATIFAGATFTTVAVQTGLFDRGGIGPKQVKQYDESLEDKTLPSSAEERTPVYVAADKQVDLVVEALENQALTDSDDYSGTTDEDSEFTVEDSVPEDVSTVDMDFTVEIKPTKQGLWGGMKEYLGMKDDKSTNAEFRGAMAYLADSLREKKAKGDLGNLKIGGAKQIGWSMLMGNATYNLESKAYELPGGLTEVLEGWNSLSSEQKASYVKKGKQILDWSKKNQSKKTANLTSGVGEYNYSMSDLDEDGWPTIAALDRELEKNGDKTL